MSPEKKNQGLFLTQEDIDTALRGADTSEAVVDAEDMEALILDEADIIDSDPEDLEAFGLLSTEDIQALLHGDLVESHGENAQDEIDSLLATATSEQSTAPPPADGQPDEGKTSQDDVEALIQKTVVGVHEKAEPEITGAPVAGPEMSEEGGAVSQDDIDQLLMSAVDDSEEDAGDGPVAGPPETLEEGGAVSQDDIDQLLMSAIDDPEDDAGDGPAAGPETPEEGGAVSQDDIDSLLAGAMDQTDVETETDFGAVSIDTQETPASRDDIESGLSQADLDQLMGAAHSEGAAEETPVQDGDTESEHISQGDINRLLKESLEAEDSPEDEAAEDMAEAPDAIEEADATEPVILAVDEDIHESTAPVQEQPLAPIPRKTSRSGFKKKRLLVGVAAGVVLVLAVSMMMLPGQEKMVLQPRVLTFAVPQLNSARSALATRVTLAGFVVLAPPNSASITYVNADLIINLSDASFVDIVKENEAFVRDIVYGTINSELMTREISTIDEISLELAIRKELGRIIPRGAIERIDFERFSMV